MFGKKTGEAGTTLVAGNCTIEGDIHFSDELYINGTVVGNIYAIEGTKARVEVSERGRVEGEIRVPNVTINGQVLGDIHSDKHVELAAKAEIKGNVFYNLIEMVMGSRVEGNLVHVDAANKDKHSKAAGKDDAVAENNADAARSAVVTPVKSTA